MTATQPTAAMLSDLTACAYRMGMALAGAAEEAKGTETWLTYIQAFDRCFFSVRVGIALELRLKREARWALGRALQHDRDEPADSERLAEPEDLADPEPPEGPELYTERDRDREVERASLPLLLKTLDGVVADAARLPGPEPAELPKLRELLAYAKSQPQAAAVGKSAGALRARLAGSAAAAAPPPDRRPASNVGQVLAARRATGPPFR